LLLVVLGLGCGVGGAIDGTYAVMRGRVDDEEGAQPGVAVLQKTAKGL